MAVEDAHEPKPRRRIRWRILIAGVGLAVLIGGAVAWATAHRCLEPDQIEQALRSRDDVEGRRKAALCLHHDVLDPTRGAAVAGEALRDPDPTVRAWAIRYLQWRVASLPPEDLEAVIAILEDSEPWASDAAARTLGHLKLQTLPHLPTLIELLDRGTPSGRRGAAFVMGMLYARAPKAVAAALPALNRALQSPDAELRNKAVWSLREFGPAAAPVAPALVRLLDDPVETTRGMASETLGKIGAPAIPALVQEIAEGPGRARRKAAEALWALARARVPGVAPVLVELLVDPDPEVRSLAQVALSGLGAGADAALLARAQGSGPLSLAALELLGRRAGPPPGAEAQDLLLASLQHDRWRVRVASRFGLARGQPYPQAAPHLLHLLADPHDPEVRVDAAEKLRRFGSQAHEALPALERALDDPAPTVRIRAASAVARIAPTRGPEMARRILRDARGDVRNLALFLIKPIAQAERAAGRPLLWWVVPLAWGRELIALLAASLVWFFLCTRFPRRRPRSRLACAAFVLVAAGVPAGVWGPAIYHGLAGSWVQPCLPEFTQLLLPFRWSAIASATLLCCMAGVFTLMRKPVPSEAEAQQPSGEDLGEGVGALAGASA